MGILKLRKDVTLRGKKGDMAVMNLRKDVTLLGKKGNMVVLKFHKDVTFLGERGIPILKVNEDITLLFLKGQSGRYVALTTHPYLMPTS